MSQFRRDQAILAFNSGFCLARPSSSGFCSVCVRLASGT